MTPAMWAQVVVGPGHVVGANQRLTLCEQQQAGTASYSDQEQDYSDQVCHPTALSRAAIRCAP